MKFNKVLSLFRMMRAGAIGVNDLTRKADAHVEDQLGRYLSCANFRDLTEADWNRRSLLGTAAHGFDILFARRQVRCETSLDLAEKALAELCWFS